MHRLFKKQIQLLLIAALVMVPLQAAFATGAVGFMHPIVCHMDKQDHAGHDERMDVLVDSAHMQMMVDCEHFTGMQHSGDASCQAADVQSGAAMFEFRNPLAIQAGKTSFSYRAFMVGGIVPLFAKPPRFII